MQIEIRTKDRILYLADSIICHNKPEEEKTFTAGIKRISGREDDYAGRTRLGRKRQAGKNNRLIF